MALTVRILSHERGLRFRNGDFAGILEPGRYRLWRRLLGPQRDRVQLLSVLSGRLVHPLLEVICRHPSAAAHLVTVDLAQRERAVVFRAGRLETVLGPGLHAFWNAPQAPVIERFDVTDPRFEHALLASIAASEAGAAHLLTVRVEAHQSALVFLDGRLHAQLGEGLHAYWRDGDRVTVRLFDRREQVLDVSGQEIMTSDKVSLRVNLLVTYRVTDPLRAVSQSVDASASLYRIAQLALRAVIGTRTLDALLTQKASAGDELRHDIEAGAAALGLDVQSVGLRDIILPGEMKAILNTVVAAEKESQANLIRRREEAAAARSQVNTARLLAEHPALARMRDMEAVQSILSGAQTTFVLGAADLPAQLRALVAPP